MRDGGGPDLGEKGVALRAEHIEKGKEVAVFVEGERKPGEAPVRRDERRSEDLAGKVLAWRHLHLYFVHERAGVEIRIAKDRFAPEDEPLFDPIRSRIRPVRAEES